MREEGQKPFPSTLTVEQKWIQHRIGAGMFCSWSLRAFRPLIGLFLDFGWQRQVNLASGVSLAPSSSTLNSRPERRQGELSFFLCIEFSCVCSGSGFCFVLVLVFHFHSVKGSVKISEVGGKVAVTALEFLTDMEQVLP